MKRTGIFTVIMLLILSGSTACAQSRYAADQFEISEFSIIETSVIANVHIRQSSSTQMTAEGSEKLLNLLNVRMDDNKLILEMDERQKKSIKGNREKLDIYIDTPTLTQIKSEGVGNIKIEGTFTTPELTIDSKGVGNLKSDNLEAGSIYITSEGVGNITLIGKADNIEIKSEGVGNINTAELTTRRTIVTSQGVGNIKCHATEYIKASSQGIGNITYYGNPSEKEISKDGLGKIKEG